MEHFAGYGFNKSHSTAYAYLAYQTAYLKANYPWHFAAALLTIEAQNTDKLALYLGECRDRQIPVLPPDINESELRFTVTPNGVRFGLTAIKNVGEGAIESLLGVRAAHGRIASLEKLCEDLDLRLVNKRVFESLTKAGAFDSLAKGSAYESLSTRELRPRLFASVDAACEYGDAAAARSQRRTGAVVRRHGRFRDRGRRRQRQPGGPHTPRCRRLDRERAARVREGNARLVLERSSGGPLCRCVEAVRRENGSRAGRCAARG